MIYYYTDEMMISSAFSSRSLCALHGEMTHQCRGVNPRHLFATCQYRREEWGIYPRWITLVGGPGCGTTIWRPA